MDTRPDNPLQTGRWYTARRTFNGRYSENSDFVEGQDYRYCGSSHSRYDSATSLSFRDRDGSPVYLWWEDDEAASLLAERFGAPLDEPPSSRLRLFAVALAIAAGIAVAAYYLR